MLFRKGVEKIYFWKYWFYKETFDKEPKIKNISKKSIKSSLDNKLYEVDETTWCIEGSNCRENEELQGIFYVI